MITAFFGAGGGEKSGARSFIAPIRSFKPTIERNPMARSASAQGAHFFSVSPSFLRLQNIPKIEA
jgi:hypothetical protein